MEFRQLEVFVRVAETKSFSKAAEILYLSQPTVSAHVTTLEKELGKTLITRSTKRFELTAEGKKLLDYARSILSIKNRIIESFEEEDFTVHLGASTIPCTYVLPDLMVMYKSQNPDVRYRVHHGDSQQIINQISEGILDLGFIGKKVDSHDLFCEVFGSDKLVIITPATPYYRGLIERKVSVKRILTEPYISREDGSGTTVETQQLLELHGIESAQLNIVATVNNQAAILNMVSSGLGISIVSSHVAEHLANNQKVCLYTLPEDYTRNLYMVYPKKRYHNVQTKRFIDFLCRSLS